LFISLGVFFLGVFFSVAIFISQMFIFRCYNESSPSETRATLSKCN
jgi:hypothetical protein